MIPISELFLPWLITALLLIGLVTLSYVWWRYGRLAAFVVCFVPMTIFRGVEMLIQAQKPSGEPSQTVIERPIERGAGVHHGRPSR